MSEVVISVENLSKRYMIRHQSGTDEGLRHAVEHFAKAPLRWLRGGWRGNGHQKSSADASTPKGESLASDSQFPSSEEFWALKNISFEVKQGEVVGIIGRNGAGKSTLLKILSRITEPTGGRVRIRGRVASLLEVGTGFHPELTGRENIFVNGAVLGMSRAEIRGKFDEIVAFAEVEKFIDTPVKRYSSGMYVRLAFAVAAHLEPEILIVDEVLAVGDAQFQRKCLGKMGEVAKGGRTVLFVSHQMNQIRRLCQTCVWLVDNQLRTIGPTSHIISAYENALSVAPHNRLRNNNPGASARFIKWEILHSPPETAHVLCTAGPVTLRFVVNVNKPIKNGHHGIFLYNSEGQLIWGTDAQNLDLERGLYELIYNLPSLPIRPGIYCWRVNLYCAGMEVDSWDCLPELVVAAPPLTHSRDEWSGVLNVAYRISMGEIDSTNKPITRPNKDIELG